MGRDFMLVVDCNLKVYGIEKLRIADASIMPRVTAGRDELNKERKKGIQ